MDVVDSILKLKALIDDFALN